MHVYYHESQAFVGIDIHIETQRRLVEEGVKHTTTLPHTHNTILREIRTRDCSRYKCKLTDQCQKHLTPH